MGRQQIGERQQFVTPRGLWEAFGEAVGTRNRSAVLREFMAWMTGRDGATAPVRPAQPTPHTPEEHPDPPGRKPMPATMPGHWRPTTEPHNQPASGRWGNLTEAASVDIYALMREPDDVVQVLDLAATLLHRHRHPYLAAILGDRIQQLAELIQYGGPTDPDGTSGGHPFWVNERSVHTLTIARGIVQSGGSLDFPMANI